MASVVVVPADLLWEITRKQSSYVVKRKTGGGAQFSRDPLNLVNKHSRKHSGVVNDQSIGIAPSEKGGVSLLTKKKNGSLNTVTFKPTKSHRKSYATIVSSTAKKGYRPDLRQAAVARASAIIKSQRSPPKDKAPTKPRGVKAKKAAADSKTETE